MLPVCQEVQLLDCADSHDSDNESVFGALREPGQVDACVFDDDVSEEGEWWVDDAGCHRWRQASVMSDTCSAAQ